MGAVSSRTGLTDRSGSLVPPGHNRGHTGRWSVPLAPVQCGTSSSSRSGSPAGLGRNHFGTPLRKGNQKKRGRLTAPSWQCCCLWAWFSRVTCILFHTSHEGRGENKTNNTTSDLNTISPRIHSEGESVEEDWWTHCAITWLCDRMMDFICVVQHSNISSESSVRKCYSGFIPTSTETVLTGIITGCQLSVTVVVMRQEEMFWCYALSEIILYTEKC